MKTKSMVHIQIQCNSNNIKILKDKNKAIKTADQATWSAGNMFTHLAIVKNEAEYFSPSTRFNELWSRQAFFSILVPVVAILTAEDW